MATQIYGQGGLTHVGLVNQYAPGMAIQTIMTKPAINLGGSAAQVLVLTVLTATVSTLYTVSVNGQLVSFTTGASSSIAAARSQLISALGGIPDISGNFIITTTSSDGVVLTAVQKGVAYPFSALAGQFTVTQAIAATISADVPAGRIAVLSGGFSDGLPRVGLPTTTAQKAYGATMRTSGRPRERGDSGAAAKNGDSMTLLTVGQIPMEFEAIVNTSVPGNLYYRAAPSGPFPDTGKLLYAASLPADCVALAGTLDSTIVQISDGVVVVVVAVVTLSL